MINWLIPMAGASIFFDAKDAYFPKPLVDVGSQMMIERVVGSVLSCQRPKRLLFVVNAEDNRKFHLGEILHLVADGCAVREQTGQSLGALCTSLLMIDEIDTDDPLIISNSDQLIDVDYDEVVDAFERQDADGGTIVFKSAHPQWSYVALDEAGLVRESAEKRPISTNAIAGFYYFRTGRSFVRAAQNAIEFGATTNGRYFISSTFNELILDDRQIAAFRIAPEAYHSFYTPAMIEHYLNAKGSEAVR